MTFQDVLWDWRGRVPVLGDGGDSDCGLYQLKVMMTVCHSGSDSVRHDGSCVDHGSWMIGHSGDGGYMDHTGCINGRGGCVAAEVGLVVARAAVV